MARDDALTEAWQLPRNATGVGTAWVSGLVQTKRAWRRS